MRVQDGMAVDVMFVVLGQVLQLTYCNTVISEKLPECIVTLLTGLTSKKITVELGSELMSFFKINLLIICISLVLSRVFGT